MTLLGARRVFDSSSLRPPALGQTGVGDFMNRADLANPPVLQAGRLGNSGAVPPFMNRSLFSKRHGRRLVWGITPRRFALCSQGLAAHDRGWWVTPLGATNFGPASRYSAARLVTGFFMFPSFRRAVGALQSPFDLDIRGRTPRGQSSTSRADSFSATRVVSGKVTTDQAGSRFGQSGGRSLTGKPATARGNRKPGQGRVNSSAAMAAGSSPALSTTLTKREALPGPRRRLARSNAFGQAPIIKGQPLTPRRAPIL
jgi:hypothetical protein